MYKLFNDDCLKVMPTLESHSIDMILCDLPYGTTNNSWDVVIPFDKLWEQYKRLITNTGCIALFAQAPFDKVLACSNLEMFKYEWIWQKTMATGFANSKHAPMKSHEQVLIFSKGVAAPSSRKENYMTYNPQMTDGVYYRNVSKPTSSNYGINKAFVTESNERYPVDIITFPHDRPSVHPTQKPVALCEYLIKTYTNEGMTVLDNCMGSGSTGVASVRLNRDFIGIEKEKKFFDIAEGRISDVEDGVDVLDFSNCY